MRRTLITALVVLALSLGLCVAGMSAVNRTIDELAALLERAGREARLGNVEAAAADMKALSARWEKRERVLEMIISHDALQDAFAHIEDARLCLEQGQREEYFRAAAAAGCGLKYIRAAEALRWENLY